MRGEARHLAERLATAAEPLAGFKPRPPRGAVGAPAHPRDAAWWAALMVLEDRRSPEPGGGLGAVIWWGVSILPEAEVLAGLSKPLSAMTALEAPAPGGLGGLMSAAARHAGGRGLRTLVRLVAVAAREAGRPCAPDPRLEARRAALERRMKGLGAALGVTLPALFVLSFYVHPLAGLVSIAAAAGLWAAVLRVGGEFRAANIEAAWARCALSRGDLEDIAYGRDLPALYDILLPRRGSL